ncbi:hypothetical protein ACWGI1_14390 [Streptomyces sp. NPDC054835]
MTSRALTWYENEDFGLQQDYVQLALVYRTVQYGANGEVLAVSQTLVPGEHAEPKGFTLPSLPPEHR